MIAPRSRLLFWFGWTVLPATLCVVAEPALEAWVMGGIAAVIGVALLDAIGMLRVLEGASAQLPAVIRSTQGRELIVRLRVVAPRCAHRSLRAGIQFPESADCEMPERWIEKTDAEGQTSADWRFVPQRRGRYEIREARLGLESRLGLWELWKTIPIQVELRVYPNLNLDRRAVAAVFLNRGSGGVHAQRQLGQGREFEKLRDYIPGDSSEVIHWKATAKRGRPITKVFQIERTQELYVMLDASRLSARWIPESQSRSRSSRETALDRFLSSTLILGQAAEQLGDLFGLGVFSDQVETFLRARSGQAHFDRCRDALYPLQSHKTTPDFDELAAFLRVRLKRRALLVYLTALDDPLISESFLRHARLMARQHLMRVFMIQTPGVQSLFSPPLPATADELFVHLAGQLRSHQLQEQAKALKRLGVQFYVLPPARFGVELVQRYLAVKQRQAL